MLGKTVLHYRILQMLGEGGIGVVYKAEDTRLHRTVALKFLSERALDSEADRTRFLHEALAIAKLDHPSITAIYETRTVDGQSFIVMPCIEGQTLETKIAEGALPVRDAVKIALQVAQGLAAAHEKDLIHRDIKPGNIMVTDGGQTKIMDFGLARLPDTMRITKIGTTLGTLAYMSPEQVRGEEVDGRSDIWALGVVMYEMIAGKVPFDADYEQAMGYAVLNSDPEPLAGLRDDLPPALAKIVTSALAKDPADRYATAQDMVADLKALLWRLDSASYSDSRILAFDRPPRRILLPIIATVLAAVSVLLGWLWWKQLEQPSPILDATPVQVTSADAWEGDPCISPDGGRIAYSSNEYGNSDIFVVDTFGGQAVQLTDDPASDRNPEWMANGSGLLFVSDRGGSPAVWQVGQYGGGASLLIADAEDPAISPDGQWIAVTRMDSVGFYRIAVAPFDDPESARFITGENDGFWNHREPAWSPDGQTICYAAHQGLRLIPANGGTSRALTPEGEYDFSPTWSSDGKRIYFASERKGTKTLWYLDVDGDNLIRLTMGTGPESNPSISRNGTRMAYSTQNRERGLVFVDLETGENSKMMGHQENYMPSLARDGSFVVFVSDRWHTKRDLWLQELTDGTLTGSARRLTNLPGTVSHPSVSPNGRWVAFYRIHESKRDIWIVSTAGGQSKQITDHPAADIHPAWSPDGSMLAFRSERNGHGAIWIMPVQEGARVGSPFQVTGEGISAWAPIWFPDGDTLAFVGEQGMRREVWVVPAARDAMPHRITDGSNASRICWNHVDNQIWVCGKWGTTAFSLRSVPVEGGHGEVLTPAVEFDPLMRVVHMDISANGKVLVYNQRVLKGNIWVLDAKERTF